MYHFSGTYKNAELRDSFDLEFLFPQNYPEGIPSVTERGGKIPSDFHRNSPGGELCLCAPSEQCLVFFKDPCLKNYVENLVNPYLFSWLWYKKYGAMPWGERGHGRPGLVESYLDLLKLNRRDAVLPLLKMALHPGSPRFDCPCGSGRPYRKCHKKIISKLLIHVPAVQLANDYFVLQWELV